MKNVIILFLLSIIGSLYAQNIPAEIDSIRLPSFRIRLFDETLLPRLSEEQKIKYSILNLQEEIHEAEKVIVEKKNLINKLNGQIQNLVDYFNKEKVVKSSIFLGLYSEETKTKKDSVIYDEKSILWGVFKWGKKKEVNKQ